MTISTKRIGIFAGGAAVLLLLIWYVAVFRPESSHLKAAHAAKAAAEAQIVTLDGQVAQLVALEKQIPQDRARLAVAKAAVPDNPQLPTVLGQLHQIATTSGVQLSTLTPGAPPATGAGVPAQTGTPSISLTMAATGSYAQERAFLVDLTTLPRTVVIDSVSLSGAATHSALSANITAQIFYAGATAP